MTFKKSKTAIVGIELAANEIALVAGGYRVAAFTYGSSGLASSSEMSMLDLQSLVSRRSTMLQETTNIMSGLNSAASTIAGNCKG